MKYVVLSFDDGFASFKEIVLPILDRFSYKASINVVTGFSDGTISNKYPRLSILDIQELNSQGHEIALHSNSHLKPTDISDFEIARVKLEKWIGCEKRGAIIPYSQSISNNLYEYLRQRCLYVADYSQHKIRRSCKEQVFRIKNLFHRTTFGNHVVSSHYYLYNKKSINHDFPAFVRLPVKDNCSPEEIIKLLEMAPNNSCLTIVFHSIVENVLESVEWPKGAWTKNNFEILLSKIKANKRIRVLTQKELFDGICNY